MLGKLVSLDVVQCVGDDLASVTLRYPLEVGSFHPLLQRPAQLERERRASAPEGVDATMDLNKSSARSTNSRKSG
jgi:hypothetical protein